MHRKRNRGGRTQSDGQRTQHNLEEGDPPVTENVVSRKKGEERRKGAS